jgi:hypothetical protein
MDADLDTLCTYVYCTADDLLPEPRRNARRRTTDAEIITLAVAQAIMGIPSDRRFLAKARKSLGRRRGGEILLGDKGYAGKEFAAAVEERAATVVRPKRKDEPGEGPHLAPVRQRIESIFWTCKDILTLERHGARTLAGLKERILQRFLCLAACISLNYQLGRPSRSLVNYCS